MIAVDTNILVYAHQPRMPRHEQALARLQELAEGSAPFALPWPCAYEFLRVVTHRRVFDHPSTTEQAWAFLRNVLDSPAAVLLSETDRHVEALERVLLDAQVSGNLVHDAHIAALLLEHGVQDFLTADADFHRFRGLRVVDL
ncbi:MAG: TA system VapC family ribonuclease toxin [Planctomycetota bacterium]